MRVKRLIVLCALGKKHRMWNEVVPLLSDDGVTPIIGSVFPAGTLQTQIESLGCATFSLQCNDSRTYPVAVAKLAWLARREGAEIVAAHEPIPAVIAGLARRCDRSRPAVFHRHHTSLHPMGARLGRWATRMCDMIIATSTATADHASQVEGHPRSNIRIVYTAANHSRPVRESETSELRTALGLERDAAVISVVAELRPEKGLDTLFEAASPVRAALSQPRTALSHQPVHIVIAGDGPARANLERHARSCPIPVHFVGHQEDVWPWFAMGDVFAMPSYYESLGVAALEAMAAERPVVASAVEGINETVVHQRTGLLVPPRNPAALAAALIEVITDRDMARRMGSAGRVRFERYFTTNAMVHGWLACYNEVLARKVHARPIT
jgi:glycosyltransferase involved in cell wall biosynthesis